MLKGKGIITDFQKSVLQILANLSDIKEFYLTGGTALSEFYFGHRKSYDLDIFTAEKNLILPFSRLVEEEFKNKKFEINVIRRFEAFTEFIVKKGKEEIRVEFAYDSPFKFNSLEKSDTGINVNSYRDIIVDKLLAFFGRAEPRDAVDLYFILQDEDFWELTNLAVQKDPGFDLYWMAVALQKVEKFPDDINRWPVEMIKEIDVKGLKIMFSKLSKEIMDKLNNK